MSRVKKLLELKNEIGLINKRIHRILSSIAEELRNSEELKREIGEFEVEVARNICGEPEIVISVNDDLDVVAWKILKFVEERYGIELDSFISLRRI